MTASALLIPPGLVLILGALLVPLMRGMARSTAMLALAFITLWLVVSLPEGATLKFSYLGYEVVPVQVDKLSRLFALVFAGMTVAGVFFALNQGRTIELTAALAYAGGALGAVLAGDLITLFVFWEIMAIASTIIIAAGGRGGVDAAFRYAVVHFLGGVLLMVGIAGEVQTSGSLAFRAMDTSTWWRWLILAGFLINAAAYPLSSWLPDAYPKASWSGMVFLSAFTTKTAVYALLRGFPGTELLIWVGLAMALYGIVYGFLEGDMRRLLAYAIVNQVGIKLVGVGIGTELALNGTAAHAVASTFYFGAMIAAAGSVLYMTGTQRLADLGGLWRLMPVTTLAAVVGAASIAALPLTSGFVSKSMIASAAGGKQLMWVWLALMAASAGVVLHAGLRFVWAVSLGTARRGSPAHEAQDPPFNMQVAMLTLAAVSIAIGCAPQLFYALLPYKASYEPYTAAHVLEQFQLVAFAAAVLLIIPGALNRAGRITIDTDWLWRRIGIGLVAGIDDSSGRVWDRFVGVVHEAGRRLARVLHSTHGPDGIMGRPWPTGTMAFWTTVMLGAYLVLAYF